MGSDGPRKEERDEGTLHVATEGEGWRFSLSDLEDREALTPGSPDPEHVAFVLLGVVVTLAVLSQFLL